MQAKYSPNAYCPSFSKLIIAFSLFVIFLSRLGGDFWLQNDWRGGPGQQMWNDPTMYLSGNGVEALKSSAGLRLFYPFWRKIGLDTSFNVSVVYDLIEIDNGILLAACRADSGGKILRSIDYGSTWNEIAFFPEIIACRSLLLSLNGLLFCGTYSDSGYVYRSDDNGFSWINIGALNGATKVNTLLEITNGDIYAGTGWNGDIFVSQNAGTIWTKVTSVPSLDVWSLRSDSQGRIYACCGSVGGLYRSMNLGITWDTLLIGSIYVPDVLVDYEENLITNMATWYILKSIDDGFSWDTVFVNPINVTEFMQSQDSSIYAGGCKFYLNRGEVSLFKSSDLGYRWTLTGGLSGSGMIFSIIQASDDLLYCGGEISMDGCIFRSSFYDSGYVISSVFDTQDYPLYGTMGWNATLNGGTLIIKVRTSQDSLMSGAMSWDLCPPVSNGQDISLLVSVNDGDRYIQYYAKLLSNNMFTTPVLHSILINYELASIKESERTHKRTYFDIKSILPNPFTSVAKLKIQEISKNAESNLTIYNAAGRLVKTVKLETSTFQLGADLVPGIYFLKLNGKPVGKVVKVR